MMHNKLEVSPNREREIRVLFVNDISHDNDNTIRFTVRSYKVERVNGINSCYPGEAGTVEDEATLPELTNWFKRHDVYPASALFEWLAENVR